MKVKPFIPVLLALVFLCSLSLAQDMPKIVDVKISGNTNVSESAIMAKVKIRSGQAFSQQLIDEDIKRLYATGYFTDVAVEAKEATDGVVILFYVQEAPYINSVVFKGNRVFNEEKLKQWIKSKPEQFFDKWQLRTDIEEIRLKYQEKGFADVKIDYELDTDKSSGKTTVVIIVNEGGRVRIKSVNIKGVKAYKEKRILKLIKTRNKAWFRSGVYKEDVLKDDLSKIESFYKKNGYLDVKLGSEESYDKKGRMVLTLNIEEGKQYKVGVVELKGAEVFSDQEVKKSFAMKEGSVFSYESLKSDTQSLQDFYFDRGYIKAAIETVPAVNPETGLVDIKYSVVENDVNYVNKIDIRGNVKTKDVVIRRELKILPGDKFEGSKIKRSRQRLQNLGYFEEIDFDVASTDEKNKQDLSIRVKESKTGELSFGAGYSSIDEFIGFVEISQRNFDIMNMPTFTGAGQQISLRAEIGTIRNDYELSFTEPWIFGHPYLFGLDLYQHSRDRARDIGYAWDEERKGFALRFGKDISEYNSLHLRLRFDKIDISNVADDVSDSLKNEAGSKNIHAARLTFARETRDNVFDPRKGYYFSSSIENVGGFMGGNVDFIRQTNQFSYFYPVYGNWILNLRMNSGIIDKYGKTSTVPLYERFFAGGAYTIRGYDERSVGPKDTVKTTDPVGGEALLVGNLELTFPVYENIKGAFFYDLGNVWAKKSDFGSGGYKSSLGCGLRLKTPIGPISLDYGYPLDAESGDSKSGRVHFSMGHKF
ncbi:MAG: outer membrane protein assembly factor BamA [Candidatus Omnitrophica bacterium]|nr:outer membrane protein assembly factor BamA [Candidatus Omnitrophota bacterium]